MIEKMSSETLGKDEAHEFANMMIAVAKGNYNSYGQNLSKGDLDEAFKVVEQLKQAAEDESTWKKNVLKILRGTNIAVQGTVMNIIFAVGGAVSPAPTDVEAFDDLLRNARNSLPSAEEKLRALREESAHKFERKAA